MHHFFGAITNDKGDALKGYYVRLIDGSGNGASLYADPSLTPIISVSGVADAVKVDSDGNANFYVAVGDYQLDIYATDSTTLVKSIVDVGLNIDADTAALAVAAQISASASAVAAAASEANASDDAAAVAADRIAADAAAADVDANTIAIQALINGYPGSAGQTIPVATRTAMKAVSSPTGSFYLYESGREGTFKVVTWSTVSADAANDTVEGYYVQSTADPTKGFQRLAAVLTPFHFGAVGDNSTNDLAALQAFNTFMCSGTRKEYFDWTGTFAVSGQFTFGPAAPFSTKLHVNFGGELRIKQLAATFVTMIWSGLGNQVFHGSISVTGIGGTTYASRTCGIGILPSQTAHNAQLRVEGGVITENFWYSGLHISNAFTDEMHIGTLSTNFCGSGYPYSGASLSATWSGTANSGTLNSTSQRTTISNISVFPDAAIETYSTVGNQLVHVRINGYLYQVYAWDRTLGTISVFPWLDNASIAAAAGKLDWVFGAGFYDQGSDANIITIDHHQASWCGRAHAAVSLYGSRISSINYATCGTALAIGLNNGASCIGVSIDAFYTEGCIEQIVSVTQFGGANYHWINSVYEVDLTKCFSLVAARDGSGNFSTTGFGADGHLSQITIAQKGRFLGYSGAALTVGAGLLSPTSFMDHTSAPRLFTWPFNSQTINLTVQGAGEYNRLFGLKGSNWLYVGTGTNNAPTGAFTFTPPIWNIVSPALKVDLTTGSAVVGMVSTAGLSAGMAIAGGGIPAAATILSVDSATQITLSTAGVTVTGAGSATVSGLSTTSGSAVATMPSTSGLIAGMPITGTGIPGSTTILSVDSAIQITLSANATATGDPSAVTVTGSVNGVFANVAFSDFNGPALFSINHTDTAQLQWTVACVGGKMGAGWIGTDQRTDVAATLNLTSSKLLQYLDVALTAARAVTLPAPGKVGRRFKFTRSANATGAFNWNINTSGAALIKALATASTWAEVEDDGTQYRLTGAGAL
jgi:hypothetical protein